MQLPRYASRSLLLLGVYPGLFDTLGILQRITAPSSSCSATMMFWQRSASFVLSILALRSTSKAHINGEGEGGRERGRERERERVRCGEKKWGEREREW